MIATGADATRDCDDWRDDEACPADPAKTRNRTWSTEIDRPVTILSVNAATVSRVFDRFEWRMLTADTQRPDRRWFRRRVYGLAADPCWGRVEDNGHFTVGVRSPGEHTVALVAGTARWQSRVDVIVSGRDRRPLRTHEDDMLAGSAVVVAVLVAMAIGMRRLHVDRRGKGGTMG